MDVAITAIGTANPIYKNSQSAIAELLISVLNLKPAEKRLLRSVYKSTGIENRYSVLNDLCKSPGGFDFFPNDIDGPFPTTAERMKIYKDNALTLALSAIQNCFLNEVNAKNKITHVITVSCTGMYAPGIDIEIIQQLNLNSSIKRTAINFMGCYGAFNGMKVAEAICKADPSATVLMVCVELCSIHFQKKMTTDNIISNAIFADGAAAILIEAKNRCKKCLVLENFYCDLLPQTSEQMAWHIGNSGFDIVLSSYVPNLIQGDISEFTSKLLSKYNLTIKDIGLFAIHPGGLKILQACEGSLGITKNQNQYAYDVLKDHGNMSSATILFVLKRIWDDLTINDDKKYIFSCAFGPGLTIESMILKVHHD